MGTAVLACVLICAWVMARVRQVRRRAWHVWRDTPDCTAHTALTALTSVHTPARFGRLKDDTTVLVVDVDLRTEAMRQAATKQVSCCVVC